MIEKLIYEFGVYANPSIREYGRLTIRIRNQEDSLNVLGELPGPNGDDEYVLSCIQDMHKVMRGEKVIVYNGKYMSKLPNGQWDKASYIKIPIEVESAMIGSGEGCTVFLWKDRCEVWNDYEDTYVEVDPQAFYQMMCDWEKAILRWREERIEMMIEEKKKPYFREYLMKMSLGYLEQMLQREREIVREEAEKRGETAEELHKKLKTEVLERIIEHEKRKRRGEIEYKEQENWEKEKERLVDEYLGIEDNQSVKAS